MARNPNTNRNGGSWTTQEINAVWRKGAEIMGLSPDIARKDKCGKTMYYSEHGNRSSSYGWEIDHINPVANGGGDEIGNLQPLHWSNNASKGDNLNWKCP